MSDDSEFRIRPGRIRSTRAQQARPFVAQALAAAQKAGGRVSRSGRITSGNGSRFGRGRVASVRAASLVMWANATKRDPVIVLEENLPVTAGKEANARTGAAQAGTAGAGAGGGGVLTNLNGDWVTTALLVVLALVLLVALARFAARARHSRLATEAMQSEITRLKKEANA